MSADLHVVPLDGDAARAARRRQHELLKPEGSLGRLEDLAVWMAGVTGDPLPEVRPRVVIAAADHGVAAEGVSVYPQEVTRQMLSALAGGGSAIAVLAREVGAKVVVVDAGVAGASVPGADGDGASAPIVRSGGRNPHLGGQTRAAPRPAVLHAGLRPSANLAAGPALDDRSLHRALEVGRGLAADAAADGANLLVGGEMGIANTTPATCLAAWLTGRQVAELCGRGTGLDDAGLARKRGVVERALAHHEGQASDPLEALRRLGGGELAVLCGLALGTGELGLGYVCDGLIATAAAAMAVAIQPDLRPRLLAGHRSPEPAHDVLLHHLALEPLLDLGMRLGEASGATVALATLRLACAVHAGMATFAQAGVSGPAG